MRAGFAPPRAAAYSAGTGFRGSAFITRPFNKIVITEAARVA